MFKYIAIVCAVSVCTLAKPSVVAPLALNAAPLAVPLAAPVVTATSSQYQVRNHNVVAAPVIAEPLVAAAPVVTATSSQYQVRNFNAVAAPVVAAAPLAAPVVTATSSQYHVRNHNALAAPVIAAAPLAAPLVSSYAYTNSWNLPYAAASYVI